MRESSENWWLGWTLVEKSLCRAGPVCAGRVRLIQRLWWQSRKGFLCRTCCSPPEVTGGVISLFNGAELIPLKQFCCCQEFIWLCWSHFHEEQGKAGLVAVVHWITVCCSRAWRCLNSQLSFQFPSLYQYNLEKKKSANLCKILFGRSPK